MRPCSTLLIITCTASLMLLACEDSSTGAGAAPAADGWSVLVSDASQVDATTDVPDEADSIRTPPQDTAQALDVGRPPAPDTADEDALLDTVDLTDSGNGEADAEEIITEPWFEPGELGEHPVTVQTVSVSGQGSSFQAKLYVPESDAPSRAVLFLPGFMLSASDFAITSERLATHGFIVLTPSFGDSFLNAIDHADLAAHSSAMLDWIVAENEQLSGPIWGSLDASGFGIAGHSRGGKIALMTALQDPRIKAVYTLDPVDSIGGPFDTTPTPENPSVTPELIGDLAIPAGFLGAGKGGEGFQPCAPAAENHEAYYDAANGAAVAYHHVDPSAGHMDYIDSGAAGLCTGGESPKEAREAGAKTLVAFMRAHLLGQDAYQSYLAGEDVDPRFTWESKSP